MTINELLKALSDALSNDWVTMDSEVTIELPSGFQPLKTENNQHHIDKEYPWNSYVMLDKVFSLTLGEPFSELEYEEPNTAFAMEKIESLEMKRKYDRGIITKDEYTDWLKAEIARNFNEDQD